MSYLVAAFNNFAALCKFLLPSSLVSNITNVVIVMLHSSKVMKIKPETPRHVASSRPTRAKHNVFWMWMLAGMYSGIL